jgi:hypothetical protein
VHACALVGIATSQGREQRTSIDFRFHGPGFGVARSTYLEKTARKSCSISGVENRVYLSRRNRLAGLQGKNHTGWRCGFALQSGFWAGSGVMIITWKTQGRGAWWLRSDICLDLGLELSLALWRYNTTHYFTGWFGAGSPRIWLVIAVA